MWSENEEESADKVKSEDLPPSYLLASSLFYLVFHLNGKTMHSDNGKNKITIFKLQTDSKSDLFTGEQLNEKQLKQIKK